ncbi:hypothetical protein [Legionella maioricensis]|uniref:SidC homolog n=1 Tax=Legionella maioricensis TaxID=2896528 RepID=A0A9X2IB22_9GAMM|nr:hypothetical protein [Legionella maioricensis]MCL9684544.1 hypothetical protein [Legionella maioricensis]MCL9687862.1 hypothetical protein [Legionella maioricensis]
MVDQSRRQLEEISEDVLLDAFAPFFKDNSPDLRNTALVNKTFNGFFQSRYKVGLLLGYVAEGNQDMAEKILSAYPELLLERGTVIDPSGRKFTNITAFELILWTLDVRYMGQMMINCIPQNEEGEMLRKELLTQYERFEKKGGVTYEYKGQTHTEKYFNFEPLLNALKTYSENLTLWTHEQGKNYWCTVVGRLQRDLPTHVRQHYCAPDEPFYPLPQFDQGEFNRTLNIQNCVTDEEQIWNEELDAKLGIDFGIEGAKIWDIGTEDAACRVRAVDVNHDLAALTRLREVRMQDCALLKEQLECPPQPVYDSKSLWEW